MSIITFQAKLESINSILLLRLPKEASDKLPSRNPVMIKGTINDQQVYTPLEPDGLKGHFMVIDQELCDRLKSKQGDLLKVELEVTKEWIEPQVPKDFKKALDNDPIAKITWNKATPMAHHEWIRWIRSTHNPDTRAKRVIVSMSKLNKGMKRPCCFNTSICTIPELSQNGKYGWILKEK